MKKASLLAVVALATMMLFGADFANALEPVRDVSGFSGFFRPGVGFVRYKTNMVASFVGFDLSEKQTSSIFDSPDTQTSAIALLPFALRYTFAGTRTELFLGTELTDLFRFDYTQQLGVKQDLGSVGIVQGGFLFNAIPAKVWEDPYIANVDRSDTKRNSYGIRLVWDRIFESDLQLQYTFRKIDIKNERSGEFLGLSTSARDLLKRDGDQHQVWILYRFTVAEKHKLIPAFIYTADSRDGDAMASDVFDFQFTYGYDSEPLALILNLFAGWADYDKQNPIYDKKQEDSRWGINGQFYYTNPWGWGMLGSEPMRFYISSAYVDSDSNISFYDQQGFFMTFGVGWRW